MRYNKKYIDKLINNPLAPLPENERIYLNVPYMARGFARHSHCGFDSKRKLWFTGPNNSNLFILIKLYGVNEATTEKATQILSEKISNADW